MAEDNDILLFDTFDKVRQESLYETKKLFSSNATLRVPEYLDAMKLRLLVKVNDEYSAVKDLKKDGLQADGATAAATVLVENLRSQQGQQGL
jgi:hypothetical protein